MPQVKIIAKNFMDMVASLPAIKLDKLYNNVFICEAILRSLPPLAKKYVLQMLYINVPVPATMLEEWVLADGASKHRVAIDRLIQLRIFSEIIDRKRGTSYSLNPTFQNNLQKHIISGGVLPREPMNSDNAIKLPSLQELETYALKQWECFLLQLINSGQGEKLTGISSSMMRIFQRGLLSQRDKDGPRLTENGFQFLLMDTNAQLWYIIREYISNAEERDVEPADLISFLLELSFHVTGEAYNLNTLTEVQINTLMDLADLGLVKLQQCCDWTGGGVPPLIALARSEAEDVHDETAAGALWNLALNPGNALRIVEEGGVPALVHLCSSSVSKMARFMAALALAYMFDGRMDEYALMIGTSSSESTSKSISLDGARGMALKHIKAFVITFMILISLKLLLFHLRLLCWHKFTERARIQEAGHLRCSGAEIGRFVTMLRNPSLTLKACAAFALLQFTIPGGRHAVHHASLMQNGGDARVLRSAAAAAANMPREAKIFAKIILRNIEHHQAESSI